MAKEYLYHYTSIETLLLILKNKTLAFNSLQNVDDLEEQDSKDVKQIGKICYVSCWIEDSRESIPLWSMYTPNMQGVRIRLKKFPFEKYKFKKDEYHFTTDVETYIDYAKLYTEGKTTIVGNQPQLVKVEYTDDEDLIYPNVRSVIEKIEELGNGLKNTRLLTHYSFEKLGKYKRKEWDFQKEYRYIINIFLWSMQELENCKNDKDQLKLIERLDDEKIKAPYDLFFLKLREDALVDLEIMLGPKVTEAQKEIVQLVVDKYCPNANIVTSKLKIK